MHGSKRLGSATFGILALALFGCGGGVTKVEVTGTVTYLDKPIENGAIKFEPIDQHFQPAGANIKNGTYRVKLPVGTAKITITGSEKIGMKKLYPTPDSLPADLQGVRTGEVQRQDRALQGDHLEHEASSDFDLK